MTEIKRIKFSNKNQPNSSFDLIQLEELLSRNENHDITQIHKIEFYQIFIATEGSGHHTIDFKDYSYEKQTLLTIREGQLHKFFKNDNAKGYLLLFTQEFLISHFSELEVLRSIQLFNELLTSPKIDLDNSDYIDLIALVKRIEAEYKNNFDEFSIGIIRSALHMLIIKLFRIKSKMSDLVFNRKYLQEFLKFQKLIEEDCFKTKKVLDYAKKMNCSSKTLNNISQNILGKSAKTLIDEVVIAQIKRMLINTSMPIKEIAYTAGFEDPTNLYKYFKKFAHTSPESFRRDK